jgi:PhzF family phenazine biosynthesis protein
MLEDDAYGGQYRPRIVDTCCDLSTGKDRERVNIPYYQIDAFTGAVFAGNPAGVCLLDDWLEDATLQAIAAENNLSETAFLVRGGQGYGLRWFTPKAEVDLCGHATLASAFVVFTRVQPALDVVAFESKSGTLTVSREGDLLAMDFPSREARPCSSVPSELVRGLGAAPDEVLLSVRDCLAVFSDEKAVAALRPEMAELSRLDQMGIIVTAPGSECDFVSRFFAPKVGVPEDPVTGSAHSTLIPYWAGRLGKTRLHARQISERGGELFCEHRGDRVTIAGRAVAYLEGKITLE